MIAFFQILNSVNNFCRFSSNSLLAFEASIRSSLANCELYFAIFFLIACSCSALSSVGGRGLQMKVRTPRKFILCKQRPTQFQNHIALSFF
ncbi:unnamed protein product [Schistosoma mattheei]|uniref:Uncharacterized protein n=1 Tax=Schistosoma mattheei TaxID=31246 RepID=A0A183PHW2_9TREM|nr:unnamed protein product [Schistosoma mattheei]